MKFGGHEIGSFRFQNIPFERENEIKMNNWGDKIGAFWFEKFLLKGNKTQNEHLRWRNSICVL